ncbi:NRDE family protein [Pseudoneobacillus sp. C159]
MCLVLFSYQTHPTYPLIVAANRDEFLKRPTASAHFWEDHPKILAGRDLKQMGTWMGVNTSGRFAALTNYRYPKEITEGKRSRGELVGNFLNSEINPKEYMEKLMDLRDHYPGYNLLAGTIDELYYYSNIGNQVQKIMPGIYGISNHLIDTDWPKVQRGKQGLRNLTSSTKDEMSEQLFTLLQNSDPAPDERLPRTGVTLEWERILSPIFISTDGYGTRSSTVLMATTREIFYKERVYTNEDVSDSEFFINL